MRPIAGYAVPDPSGKPRRAGWVGNEESPVMLGRLLVAGAALVTVTGLAGCGSSQPDIPTVSVSVSSTASSPPGTVAPASQGSGQGASPSGSAISIPPYLCDATDQAQNAADAYMGALSAGNEKQAVACVLPGTVPIAVTRALLATVKGTAVYLPRDGVDGPSVFGYQGNGKSVDVTVTKQRDGRFWVTKVAVRGG
jgi:hypothetical protein